ncbi:helix-turn-helix domain-containing protein [Rhizobium sp. K102]|uniref:helix-turn-helix domain-containing protein n=1 Tax=Rhizobium sp. K102 TaxID=2918527 RepID=UPI001EFBE06F|nr:helix-turn-helix domain-containing protein [Rhizobium sp. K102]ULR43161.1 helix-turn-helix domain-containing protein [Rhizobium sp. K102]
MMSFLDSHSDDDYFTLDDPKAELAAEFVTHVGTSLQKAFVQRKADSKLTQQKIADLLGVDRSRIHRCLSGYQNLTLETVAELVWAMRGRPEFRIILEDEKEFGCNFHSFPEKEAASPRSGTKELRMEYSSPPVSATATGQNSVHWRSK